MEGWGRGRGRSGRTSSRSAYFGVDPEQDGIVPVPTSRRAPRHEHHPTTQEDQVRRSDCGDETSGAHVRVNAEVNIRATQQARSRTTSSRDARPRQSSGGNRSTLPTTTTPLPTHSSMLPTTTAHAQPTPAPVTRCSARPLPCPSANSAGPRRRSHLIAPQPSRRRSIRRRTLKYQVALA